VPLTPRRGATVAELAIALLLAGVAAALGAGMLLSAERRARREGDDSHASQTTRDVVHAVGSDLASARWNTVVVRGDTALDLQAHVGTSVACVVAGASLVLPAEVTSGGEPWTSWRYQVEVTDIVAAWDSSGGGSWVSATVDSVFQSASGAGCAAGSAFRSLADSISQHPVTRLHLSIALPVTVGPGAPVRVFRGVRWTLYRGGDGAWWLGQRRCAATCGAVQPVAGPLAPPADTGLVFISGPDGAMTLMVRAASDSRRENLERRSLTVRGVPRGAP
jgi:hypothetical protein